MSNYLHWTYYLIPRLILGLILSVFAVYGAVFVWSQEFKASSTGFPTLLAIIAAGFAFLCAWKLWHGAGKWQLEFYLRRARQSLEDKDFPAGRRYYRKAIALTNSSHYSPAGGNYSRLQFFHKYADFLCEAGSNDNEALDIYTEYFAYFPEDSEFAGKVIPLVKSADALEKKRLVFLSRLAKLRPEYNDFANFTAEQYLINEVYDTDGQEILLDAVRHQSPLQHKALKFLLPKMLEQERADAAALEVYLQALYHKVEHHDLKPMLGRIAEKARYEESPGAISKLIVQAVDDLPAGEKEALKASLRQERLKKVVLKEEAEKAGEFLPEKAAAAIPKAEIPPETVKTKEKEAVEIAVKPLWKGFFARQRTALHWIGIVAALAVVIYCAVKMVFYAQTPKAVSVQVISDKPYTIQAGAFKDRERALTLIKTLNQHQLQAYLTPPQEGSSWYQVRLGHYDTLSQARAVADELKNKGIISNYFIANFQGGIYVE